MNKWYQGVSGQRKARTYKLVQADEMTVQFSTIISKFKRVPFCRQLARVGDICGASESIRDIDYHLPLWWSYVQRPT